jgi:hypothetical protein
MDSGQTLWAASIAAGGAILGATAAGVVTYRITSRQILASQSEALDQRNHDSDERALDRAHERTLALEERLMTKRAEAYLRVIEYCDRLSTWWAWAFASATNTPTSNTGGGEFSEDSWYHMKALLVSFGTAEVNSRFDEFRTSSRGLAEVLGRPGRILEIASIQDPRARERLEQMIDYVDGRSRELSDRIADELQART